MATKKVLKERQEKSEERVEFRKDRVLAYEISVFIMFLRIGAYLNHHHLDKFLEILTRFSMMASSAVGESDTDEGPLPPNLTPGWDWDPLNIAPPVPPNWRFGPNWDPLNVIPKVESGLESIPPHWLPGLTWNPTLNAQKKFRKWFLERFK